MSTTRAPEESTAGKWTKFKNMNIVFSMRNVESSVPHLKPYLESSTRILDVGCGIGTITLDFAKRCPLGQVIGIDVDADSIAIARSEAEEAGVNNIEYLVGDAYDLSAFSSGSFDVVHAHQVHLHLKEPVKSLEEMRRVAKPETGIVAIKDNAQLIYVGCTDLISRQKTDLENAMYKDGIRGLQNHIWINQAGFPWSSIQTGVLGWELSGPEGMKRWVAGAKPQSGMLWRKFGMKDEEKLEELLRDHDAWEKNPEARVLGLDGWVIAKNPSF